MSTIIPGDRISYASAVSTLFPSFDEQTTIPFLGAGVSWSGRSAPPGTPTPPASGDPAAAERLVQDLGFDGRAATFLRLAVSLASLIAAREKTLPPDPPDPIEPLQTNIYPPSAGELAEAFSALAKYSDFERVARRLFKVLAPLTPGVTEAQIVEVLRRLSQVTNVANPPDALTRITSYYEHMHDRGSIWGPMMRIFGSKTQPTETHTLLADIAARHLAEQNAFDYLILSTNYDCLMEHALDLKGVPYVVLYTNRETQRVVVRFSETVGDARLRETLLKRNSNQYPRAFRLSKSKSLVLAVIYKIHGCLHPRLQKSDDGIVLSDDDYVNHIRQMSTSNGVTPSEVTSGLVGRKLLFLGYSLSDWNVRSIFAQIRSERGTKDRDYAVTLASGAFEELFFSKNDVTIYQTDLNAFASGIRTAMPGLIS